MNLRDPQTFRQLYEAHGKGLYNLAYRLLRDKQWAEDVLQETFVRAYTRAETFRQGGKVSTWLYRICMNLCYDHLRARKYRAMASIDAPTRETAGGEAGTSWSSVLPSDTPAAADAAEKNDTEECVRRLIEALPERERTVVLLRQYHGMTFKEIAEVLGLTARTVQNCLRRAKNKLYFGLKHAGLAPANQYVT